MCLRIVWIIRSFTNYEVWLYKCHWSTNSELHLNPQCAETKHFLLYQAKKSWGMCVEKCVVEVMDRPTMLNRMRFWLLMTLVTATDSPLNDVWNSFSLKVSLLQRAWVTYFSLLASGGRASHAYLRSMRLKAHLYLPQINSGTCYLPLCCRKYVSHCKVLHEKRHSMSVIEENHVLLTHRSLFHYENWLFFNC